MKKLVRLLFFIIFLSMHQQAFPSNDVNSSKELRLKEKLAETILLKQKLYNFFSFFMRRAYRPQISSEDFIDALDSCTNKSFNTDFGIEFCKAIKEELHPIAFIYTKAENNAIKEMMNLIDKNVDRAEVLRNNVPVQDKQSFDDIAYKHSVKSWWNWLNYTSDDLLLIQINLGLCMSLSLGIEGIKTCSSLSQSIKDSKARLKNDEVRTVADHITQQIDTNINAHISYNNQRKKYFDAVKDLYND